MSEKPMERLDPETGLRLDDQGRRLCSANRSQGNGPCRAPAVSGQRVCRKHGGASPQAKRKAVLRLAELINPAVATLAREMAQADKSADKQRAANSILDRAGVPRSMTTPDGEAARELLLERLYQMREEQSREVLPEGSEGAGDSDSDSGDSVDLERIDKIKYLEEVNE